MHILQFTNYKDHEEKAQSNIEYFLSLKHSFPNPLRLAHSETADTRTPRHMSPLYPYSTKIN